MHEHLALRHVAQGRHFESTAEFFHTHVSWNIGAKRWARPLRPAQAQVEVRRIGIGWNGHIARNTAGVVPKVGKKVVGLAAGLGVHGVAARAIAFFRIHEQVHSAGLGCRELSFASYKLVVTRRKRLKLSSGFMGCNGLGYTVEGFGGILKDVGTKHGSHLAGVV